MPATDAVQPAPESATLKRWRERLLDTAVLTIPNALILQATAWVQGKLFLEPWQILAVAVPLAGLVFIAWKLLRAPTGPRIDARFAAFLVGYVTVFGILSASDFLVWKRAPVFGDEGGRAWLLPVSAGDWRYRLVRDVVPATRLYVALLDHDATSPDPKRLTDALLIEAAVAGRAKGVFFDVAFAKRPGEEQAEEILCGAVRNATAASIPVITAYRLRPNGPVYVQDPAPDSQNSPECLLEGPLVYRAHAMVFADVDGRVRSVPTTWLEAPVRSALSVRIAQCMTKSGCDQTDLALPDGRLLRFLPGTLMNRHIFEGNAAVEKLISDPSGLQDQFLLVGERSGSDRFRTPSTDPTGGIDEATGEPMTAGAMIHAYAANSLSTGLYFERPPAWFSGFIVLAVCAILALMALEGASARKLLVVAALESVSVVALSAFAARFLYAWLDVVYALVALWLLLPLLLAYRQLGAPRVASTAAPNVEVPPAG